MTLYVLIDSSFVCKNNVEKVITELTHRYTDVIIVDTYIGNIENNYKVNNPMCSINIINFNNFLKQFKNIIHITKDEYIKINNYVLKQYFKFNKTWNEFTQNEINDDVQLELLKKILNENINAFGCFLTCDNLLKKKLKKLKNIVYFFMVNNINDFTTSDIIYFNRC